MKTRVSVQERLKDLRVEWGLKLEELAELTHARVFDGREDLIGAFRSVKGYN